MTSMLEKILTAGGFVVLAVFWGGRVICVAGLLLALWRALV
jgi:hypothetical protein